MIRRLIILLLIVGCGTEPAIEGCMDNTACNYNSEAIIDDGNCIAPQGCNNWCESSLEVAVSDSSVVNQNGALELDCADVCGGDAEFDNCGVCDGNLTNDCTQDCAGVWGGFSYLDDCGGCDANTTNDNTTCEQDCAEVWGGTAVYDECGVCGGDGAVENYDCDGNCIAFYGCDGGTESSSFTLTSFVNYQSNDCSGSGSEEACTDVDGNVSDILTTQISCVAEGLSWINYYQEWVDSIDNTNSFNTIIDPNNNTCTITYDDIVLDGVWTDSHSCQIPNSTITSGNCVEFIFFFDPN